MRHESRIEALSDDGVTVAEFEGECVHGELPDGCALGFEVPAEAVTQIPRGALVRMSGRLVDDGKPVRRVWAGWRGGDQ